MTDSSYPFTGLDGSCKYASNVATPVVTTGRVSINTEDPVAMQTAVMENILSVAVCSAHKDFQLYSGGIFDQAHCGTLLDHATNVVGWGHDDKSNVDYWIMRNSWGTSWGDQGYMLVKIQADTGICGIQIEPQYATV
jgi:hypothetical protein